MRTRDIKALNETIASVVDPVDADRAKALQEGYLNSLTEKARQVISEADETKAYLTTYEPKPMPKPKKPKYAPIPKIPKSTGTLTSKLNEKAAPGMEDWASDPKVKASFMKQYGKGWKEVMYARSWNLAKKEKELGVNEEAELDLAEGVSAKRMRIIRKHLVSGKPVTGAVKDFMDRSIKKKLYRNKTKFGGETQAVLGRAALKHSAMKAKGLVPESLQLDELSDNTLFSARWKAHQKGRTGLTGKIDNELIKRKLLSPPPTSMKEREAQWMKKKGMYEEVEVWDQLDEAGYKKLNRLRGKAYDTGDPKIARAAAELQSKVAARMAMKGGASAEAVKGGGSLIGKRGKYTKKAGNLANQRSKAIASFRNLNIDRGVARDTGTTPIPAMVNRLQGGKPRMSPEQVAKKREAQAKMRDFRNRARSGDFGQNNQEGMRLRHNYLKRTGQL